MQVKKFEARSMKEALEMVKRQLGPDAIILSARDHGSRFGLVGNGSVEITAAVSAETLQKKQFAESRMKPDVKEKFLSSPARQQRKILDQFVEKYQSSTVPKPARAATGPRYADIADDHNEVEATAAETRIKDAASRAWDAMRLHTEAQALPVRKKAAGSVSIDEYQELRDELERMKRMFSQFQKVPQSIELVDNTANPLGHSPEALEVRQKLIGAGLSEGLADSLLTKAQRELKADRMKTRGLIEGWIAQQILESTQVVGEKAGTRIHNFIGPVGGGKSSALVKLAASAVLEKNKSVAILTCDTFKVGAADQMKIYSQILNVPFGVVRRPTDWIYFLDKLQGVDLILCDFPGLSLKNSEDLEQIRSFLPVAPMTETHLVFSALSRREDMEEASKRYSALRPDSLIFNHLDEAQSHGAIYEVHQKTGVPLHSFGLGPRMPEDFEMATRERVLDLIFKLTKIKRGQEQA